MYDAKIEELARQIVQYSVGLQPGENLLIESWDGADDMTVALIEAAYQAGGYPFVCREDAAVQRRLLLGGSEESFRRRAEVELARMEKMDACVMVRKMDNSSEYADVPAEKMTQFNLAMAPVKSRRMKHTKWCVLRYPNPSMAQMCRMSTEQFREYYFQTCVMDYEKMTQCAQPLNDLLGRTDRVRIVGPGTNLDFSIKGQRGGPAFPNDTGCGRLNLPDGECSSCPVMGTVEGEITYNVPTTYNGVTFQQIYFRFEKGKIVEAKGGSPILDEAVNQILDTDENARYIGEFSLGINPFVTHAIGDTLFDEKMWGTLHFTPGHSPSAVHWDIVLSQRPEDGGGELWFDDVLIRKDGLYLPKELRDLNPDEMVRLFRRKEG